MAFTPFPSGTVLAFAGSAAPSGWLLCDGTSYSQSLYPELFAVLQTTYNTQTDPTTNAPMLNPGAGNFRVPNYTGAFIRGTGTPYAGDTATLGGFQIHKTRTNGITVSGGSATLTGTTTFASSAHNHEVPMGTSDQLYASAKFGSSAINSANAAGRALGATSTIGPITMWLSGDARTTATVGLSNTTASIGAGDTETRPHNVGVNYIIKI